jgi:hypothetical protein
MTTRLLALTALGATALAASIDAQGISVRSAVLFESYSFDSGLVFTDVSEMTVPVTVDVPLGRAATFTMSSGFASVGLTSAVPSQLADQSASGMLDTEMRLAYNVIPGRLILLVTGTVPSGMKTLAQDELFVLGPLSSDIIGFSAPSLGSGGGVGGGFAGAFPLGSWALGLGGTFRLPMGYEPVAGRPSQLQPGSEFRTRVGLEGPLARRTYVRLAGVYAQRGKDAVSDSLRHGIGNRIISYLALSQGIGARNNLTLYGFTVYRGGPQVEASALGAALLPRGMLIASGGRLNIGIGQNSALSPRAEYRVSASATDTTDTKLRHAGRSLRAGVDLRLGMGRAAVLVLQSDAVLGSVVQAGADVGLGGFRFGLQLELRP